MLRICDVCGDIDDLNRHIFSTDGGFSVNEQHIAAVLDRSDIASDVRAQIIADISDTTVQMRHFSCCATAGCPAAGTNADCSILI